MVLPSPGKQQQEIPGTNMPPWTDRLSPLSTLGPLLFVSIEELRHFMSKSLFLPSMKRIQDYMECYVQTLNNPAEQQAAAYIVLQSWAALRQYTRLVHQRVYAEYTELLANPALPNRRDVLRSKLQYMNKVAEYACGCESGLLRAQSWENRLNAQ